MFGFVRNTQSFILGVKYKHCKILKLFYGLCQVSDS